LSSYTGDRADIVINFHSCVARALAVNSSLIDETFSDARSIYELRCRVTDALSYAIDSPLVHLTIALHTSATVSDLRSRASCHTSAVVDFLPGTTRADTVHSGLSHEALL